MKRLLLLGSVVAVALAFSLVMLEDKIENAEFQPPYPSIIKN